MRIVHLWVSVFGGLVRCAVWGAYRTFRKQSLAEGTTTQGMTDFELCSLAPPLV